MLYIEFPFYEDKQYDSYHRMISFDTPFILHGLQIKPLSF